MDTPDPAVYPKYLKYLSIKQEVQKELLDRRSELLKLKHQEGIQDLGEIKRLLEQNHEYLVQIGIWIDVSWDMPIISEIFKDSDC